MNPVIDFIRGHYNCAICGKKTHPIDSLTRNGYYIHNDCILNYYEEKEGRGQGKRYFMLLDEISNTIIHNVKWAHPKTGEYMVYKVDTQGELVLDAFGNPATELKRGTIRLLKVVNDDDYRILTPKE